MFFCYYSLKHNFHDWFVKSLHIFHAAGSSATAHYCPICDTPAHILGTTITTGVVSFYFIISDISLQYALFCNARFVRFLCVFCEMRLLLNLTSAHIICFYSGLFQALCWVAVSLRARWECVIKHFCACLSVVWLCEMSWQYKVWVLCPSMKQKPAFVTQFLGVKIGYISIHSLCCLYCLLTAKHQGIFYAVVFDTVMYPHGQDFVLHKCSARVWKKNHTQNNHHLLWVFISPTLTMYVCVCVCVWIESWSGWDVGLCSGFRTKGRVILWVGGFIDTNTKQLLGLKPSQRLDWKI